MKGFIPILILLIYSCSDSIDNLTERGIAKYEKGKFIEAKVLLTKSIKLKPKSEIAFMYLGFSDYNLHDYKSAIEDFSKVLILNPKSADAYKFKGLAEYHKEDMQSACQDFISASNLGSIRAYSYHLKYCK